jgi:hypothetical protein
LGRRPVGDALDCGPPGRGRFAKPADLVVSNSDWHEAHSWSSGCRSPPSATLCPRPIPWCWCEADTATSSTLEHLQGNLSARRRRHFTQRRRRATGELVDNAKRLVSLPPPKAVTVADVLTTQRKLNAYGITSVRIPGSHKGEFFQALDAILAVRRAGELSLRYTIYLPGSGVRDLAMVDFLCPAATGVPPAHRDVAAQTPPDRIHRASRQWRSNRPYRAPSPHPYPTAS